ncbi:MAG: hypothetical protein IJT12_09200 [Paludibacteraceae bacterium]|nr:hypothetical protein [Paludibacteraceae bacterium]
MDLTPVKNQLQRLTCPVHHQHPDVRIVRGKDSLQFSCCCQAFGTRLEKESERLMQQLVKESVDKRLDSLFK